jgi:hypothetical protein
MSQALNTLLILAGMVLFKSLHLQKGARMVRSQLSCHKKLMLLILLVSFILRLYLILHGGAFYWSDETRYQVSRSAVNFIFSDDIKGALNTLSSPDHLLFKVIGIIPATFEKVFSTNPKIPALFFSLFSVLNLWVIWKISLSLGAEEAEALLTVFLLALASSFFYYSRHLLPYDNSMTFGLLALLIAVRRPAKARDSLLCGLLSMACFLTYTGYWTIAAFAMIMHVIWPRPGVFELISRAWRTGFGFFVPLFVLFMSSALFGGDLFHQFINFSHTVTQGSFSEGGTLPIEYLWHTEHLLLPLWIVAFIFSLWDVIRRTHTRRLTVGVAGVLFIHGFLFLTSVGLHKFVVYGRLSRQLVPFFCLISGCQLQRLREANAFARRTFPLLCVMMVLMAAFNFYIPMKQEFPSDFIQRARKTAETLRLKKASILFATHIYPVPKNIYLPPHKMILRARHPLQFFPYQYEGYTPEQRTALRSIDISMRLVIPEEEKFQEK